MHVAHLMVLIAGLMPYLTIGAAKAGPGYDNASPRDSISKLDGLRARANWCHANHFEAFAPFAAAVILAEQTGAAQATINLFAMIFIGFRVAYTACYLGNAASLRTLMWMGGFACVIKLFVLSV